MTDWVRRLFIERSDLFLRLLNQKWLKTQELVNGMTRILAGFGVESGNLLDLCCGNGRVSISMAERGFKTVGVDISRAFLEDATRKARDRGVSNRVTFLEGDVRNLNTVIGKNFQPFDVIANAWTSIGFYKQEDDLNIFKQARQLSKESTILFIAETIHTEYLSLKFTPTSYTDLDHLIMLENRKYDPLTAQINTTWTFYNKRDRDLEFVDKVDISHHVYSLSELVTLLRNAGWETVATYGSLSALQPISPLTHMNIVAKAM